MSLAREAIVVQCVYYMNEGDLPVQVYKPLRDKYLDELFKVIRSRFGGYNVPKHSTAREIIKLRKEGKHIVIGLITDQSPNRSEAHYWTTFLNQETVFMDGAERIAKMMKFPVYYCELIKERRGHCRVSFDLITEFPKDTADGEITETFVRRLEQTIRKEPAYWFWSHKRWKFKREDLKQHGVTVQVITDNFFADIRCGNRWGCPVMSEYSIIVSLRLLGIFFPPST